MCAGEMKILVLLSDIMFSVVEVIPLTNGHEFKNSTPFELNIREYIHLK